MRMELRSFLFVAAFLITCAGLALAQDQTTTPPDKSKTQVDKAVDKTQTEVDKAKTEVADKAQDVAGDKDKSEAGKVRVNVSPEEAYIFVDGKPYRHRSTTLVLAPGEHTITVYNYGYEPMTQKVQVSAGSNPEIEARLKPAGEPVSGPWGRIQIEGAPGDAPVFLNGDTQPFFVGHVDEMNNNFKNKQQLIVPPGTHQLLIVRRKTGEQVFSGPVDVKENQRVIVYVRGNGKADMVYKNWSGGAKIKSLKRFEAGTATATIAVAPVTGKLSADKDAIKCNEPVKLNWTSDGATVTTVTANNDKVAEGASGTLDVQPKQTTKYEFRAAGPGGIKTSEATINVDPTVKASLTASEPELRYVKVGDQVQEQGKGNLNWTASNADSVRIDPIGPVTGTSGSQDIQATPTSSDIGPVDETKTYKITATNVCGGSDTTTASVHLTGSIEPVQVAEAEPEPALPATASPLPLLALLGLLSVAAGGVLRRYR
jgi:PEGA domain